MILEFIIVVIISQFLFGLFLWYQVKDLYGHPNIFGFPIIGNLYYFYKGFSFRSLNNIHDYSIQVSEQGKNGICFAYIKGRKSVVLSCPHIIEEISHNINAAEKASNYYGVVNPLIKGVFTYCPIDSEWKLRRKEINNSLTKGLIDGPYSETFNKIGKDLVRTFEANKDNVDLIYHCTIAALHILQETHCGIQTPMPHKRRVYYSWIWVLRGISLIFTNPFVSFIFAYTYKIFEIILLKKMDILKEQVGGSVAGHLKSISKDPPAEPKFLPLSVVIALRNKNRNLHKTEMRKELYELLVAGSHTAAVTLTGSFAYMATLPEIQEKVWQEQYEIFGRSKRDPNLDDLRKMTYLDRFVKEILRFFGPGILAKNTTAEVKAGGVTIPVGTTIIFLLGKLRMDPKYWKDPQVFNPEHNFDDKPKYANAAFGVGIRSCPGMYYARQELKIILSIIVRNYKLSSSQKFEDFRYVSHLMPEINNLLPIQVEKRI